MTKIRTPQQMPLIVTGRPVILDRVQWLYAEMFKTRVAHAL